MAKPDFPPICAAVLQDWKAARRRVLKSGATRGAVHALRIHMRRLLALEALLAPGGKRRATALDAGLHDIFHASGRLRDAQLVARELRDLARAMPCAGRLAQHERQREARLQRQLCRELRATPVAEVARILRGWLQPGRGDPRVLLAERVARRLRGQFQRLTTAKSRGSTTAHRLHRHRVRLKQLRYMAELARAAGCALPQSLSLDQLARQQQRLGAVTDIDMQLHKVARFGAKHPDWRPCARQLRLELRRRRAGALQSV